MITQDIKPGYKQSSLGPIPENWTITTFGDIADIDKNSLSGNTNPEYTFNYISLGDVDSEDLNIETSKQIFKTAPSRARRIVKQGDILMSTVRPYLQGFIIVRENFEDLIASTGFSVITCKNCVNEYLFQYLFSNLIQKQFHQLIVGSNYPAINSKDVKNLKIPLPTTQKEQEKIANILLKIDSTIQKTKLKIENLELRNKGLIQQLLSGKLRLKGFSGSWKLMRFKDIFIPFKEKAGNNNYELLSVTKDGIYSQREYFNKEISSDDVSEYLVIKKGDFAMSGLNFRMGSAHMLYEYEAGIISPAYKTFHIKNENVYTDFMRFFIESSSMRRALVGSSVQGASIVRRNLDSEMLENRQFSIPTLEEQKTIANVLNKATKQLDLYKQKLEKLQELKKGLMQQLLTGKVRVKEFRN